MPEPSRGEVWLAQLSPTRGHEQAGTRPCLIVAADRLSHGASGLTIVVPITSRRKGVPFHVEILPPEGGLTSPSFAKCEDVRPIDRERLVRRLGRASDAT